MTGIGTRIATKRIQRGWSLRELEQKSGIPYVRIHRFEKGEIAVSIEETLRLSESLGIDPKWLATGSNVRERVLSANRLNSTKINENQIDFERCVEVLEYHQTFQALRVLPENQIPLPRIPLQAEYKLWAKNAAEDIRLKFSNEIGPIEKLSSALEETFGIYVMSFPDSARSSGFALHDPKTAASVIGISPSEHFARQRFSLAHELGHLISETFGAETLASNSRSQVEIAMDEFARHLLIPEKALRAIKKNSSFILEVSRIAYEYGVSSKAMAIALERSGLVTTQEGKRIQKFKTNELWSLYAGDLEVSLLNKTSSQPFASKLFIQTARTAWQKNLIRDEVFSQIIGVAPEVLTAMKSM